MRGLAFNAHDLPAWNRLEIGAHYTMDIGSDRRLTRVVNASVDF